MRLHINLRINDLMHTSHSCLLSCVISIYCNWSSLLLPSPSHHPSHTLPPHTHLKQACGRICRALKKEFVPYLPALVPALLHAARAKTDMKVCSYVSYCVCMDVCVYVCVTLVSVLLHAARVKMDLKVFVFLFILYVCMHTYVFVWEYVYIYT